MKVGIVGGYSGVKTHNYQKNNNLVFKRGIQNNFVRSAGYALTAAALLSFMSCINSNKSNTEKDTLNTKSEISNDTTDSKIKKAYHYFPTNDGIVSSDKYDWLEVTYPDGSIDRDSLNHKIHITPEGYRTDIKTEQDKHGNVFITTVYPDNSRIEKADYKSTRENEKITVEKKFRSDNTLSEIKYRNEYPSDSTDANSTRIVEESLYSYNENDVLIKWVSNVSDFERNAKNNKYDRKKRLIYDDVKNEYYYYKGNNSVPYRSISVLDGCKRITLYNNEGSAKRVYFKASDGTITEE